MKVGFKDLEINKKYNLTEEGKISRYNPHLVIYRKINGDIVTVDSEDDEEIWTEYAAVWEEYEPTQEENNMRSGNKIKKLTEAVLLLSEVVEVNKQQLELSREIFKTDKENREVDFWVAKYREISKKKQKQVKENETKVKEDTFTLTDDDIGKIFIDSDYDEHKIVGKTKIDGKKIYVLLYEENQMECYFVDENGCSVYFEDGDFYLVKEVKDE